MSVRNEIALFIALSTLTLLVGCGSSSPTPVAPPSGAFSNSNLNGTYVFSSSGVDANGDLLAMTGTVKANGSGGITSGTVDLIGQEITPSSPVAQPISSGSYSITADGRGQISFNTTTINSSSGAATGVTFILDLVLTSSSHGLVTEYDSNGTGSGTIDLQTPVSQSQIVAPYSFGLSGAGLSGSPLATVGAMTLGATGSVTTGLQDINNDGSYTGVAISTSSFVNLGSTPGTAVIANTSGTFGFDVYPIDSTHLKFIETDGAFLLTGDAYTQATSISSGQLVYTMAGEDTSGGPIDVGGWLTNSSGTITAGLEDFNDALTVGLGQGISGGGFSALSGGRSTLNLTGFVNGAASDLAGSYTFAAYPFTYTGGTGIQLLEIDGLGITSGAAYPQSSTTLAAPPQGYGFNLTGINPNGEEDDIAEFVTSSSGFNGIADLNDDAVLSPGKALSATYVAPDGNGEGSATTNYWAFNFYVVNPTTYILLETDASQVGMGTFEQQSNSSGGAVQSVVSMLRPPVRPHSALKRRN
ncbi:MAG: hypothetical protein WCA20_27195 [Candidatus Sulfotelmatobacter sp.]